ncbi:MAG: 4Fe-4S binding protein [Tannerella sp.]|jgi:NADH-quinone oxidoreductase subunit I|nr:4Fe-4S binding protein [Tannerella sp.]
MTEKDNKMDTNNTSQPYLGGIFHGLATLLIGLKVTFIEFFTRKVTEEYPDNRDTLVISDRFRGTLYMPLDGNGKNKCTACGLCEMNCPNDTLHLETEMITDEETGKKRKVIRKYQYDLGSCMFCRLCVNVCPASAIAFETKFEHAVFNKDKLVKILNETGNK